MSRQKSKKTARLEFRLTPYEKDVIRRAGELSVYSATSDTDIARDSAVLTAESLLKIKAGELSLLTAMENYESFLKGLLGDVKSDEVAP